MTISIEDAKHHLRVSNVLYQYVNTMTGVVFFENGRRKVYWEKVYWKKDDYNIKDGKMSETITLDDGYVVPNDPTYTPMEQDELRQRTRRETLEDVEAVVQQRIKQEQDYLRSYNGRTQQEERGGIMLYIPMEYILQLIKDMPRGK